MGSEFMNHFLRPYGLQLTKCPVSLLSLKASWARERREAMCSRDILLLQGDWTEPWDCSWCLFTSLKKKSYPEKLWACLEKKRKMLQGAPRCSPPTEGHPHPHFLPRNALTLISYGGVLTCSPPIKIYPPTHLLLRGTHTLTSS